MNLLIAVLVVAFFLNILTPAYLLKGYRSLPQKILLISTFGGLIFYVGIPLLVVHLFPMSLELPKVWISRATYFAASDISTVTILFYLFVILAAGNVFSWQSSQSKSAVQPESTRSYPCKSQTLAYFSFIVSLIIAIGLTYKLAPQAEYLFSGYRTHKVGDAFGGANRSALAGFTLMMLSVTLINLRNEMGFSDDTRLWDGIIILLSRPFFYFWLTASIALISIGTRQYLVISITSIALALISFETRKSVNIFPLLCVGLIGTIAIGAVGALRIGQSLSITGVFSNILLEPLFTFYTTFNLAKADDIPIVTAPAALINGILNLVPAILFPTKTEYFIRNYQEWNESPFGAVSWIVSLISNFGLAGAAIFIFVVYFYARKLYSKRILPLWIFPLYCMIPSLLMFNWMRDPWDLTLKITFEYGLALPFFMVMLSFSLDSVIKNYKRNQSPRITRPESAIK